ncbi:NnrS family protein [soil metagenome]
MKQASLHQIEEPVIELAPPWSLGGIALLGLGFRPFYLLAAVFAVISIPLWLARYTGWLQALPQLGLDWHMHEMLYGFALAVIIGFLFTAARNWTGLWTPRRWTLAIIASVWLAGRMAMLLGSASLAAAIDLLFIPCAALPLYLVMQKSGKTRNLPLLAILGLLFIVNGIFHATRIGWLDLPLVSLMSSMHAAILLIVILEVVMAGRVIPGFTANVIVGCKPVVNARLDKLSLMLSIATSLAWLGKVPTWLLALLAFACAGVHVWRLAGWQPWKTLRRPLLWVLHLAYAWIAAGFFLLGLAALEMTSASTAMHALAIASMSSLIMGMMTRTTLGHTGRLLKAGNKEVAMFLLLQAGALARLVANLNIADIRPVVLLLASVCWSAAFLLFVLVYGPYLITARLDGREG